MKKISLGEIKNLDGSGAKDGDGQAITVKGVILAILLNDNPSPELAYLNYKIAGLVDEADSDEISMEDAHYERLKDALMQNQLPWKSMIMGQAYDAIVNKVGEG